MRKLFIILFAILLASCASTDNIPTVSVTGSASVSMLPDMLSFTVTASRTAETTEEARSTVSMMINSAVEILQNEYAVDDDDIVTAYVSVSPEYSWKDGESILLGQRAVQSVDVTLHDIDAAGKVFQSLSSIDGIGISSITADKENKSLETMKARSFAVQDAHDKAAVYANAAGYVLGDLVSLSDDTVSAIQYANRMYAMEAASASDTMSYYVGDISISDSVTAVYELLK